MEPFDGEHPFDIAGVDKPASGDFCSDMLSVLDIVLALLFLGGIALAGIFLWKSESSDDYFLAGRSLPWPAILASIVATETSTLTFIGAPAISYVGTVSFLQLAVGYILGRVLVALLILPGYFSGSVSTAYEVLSNRVGEGTRRLASLVFLVTRTLADGVRLYASALVIAVVTGIGIVPSIVLVAGLTIAYTLRGGLVAVVWTDFVQLIVYLLGAVFALFLLVDLIPGGVAQVYVTSVSMEKFGLFDLELFSSNPYTLWAGILGGAFLSMASHGTDHLIVQRLLAAGDLRRARKALVASGVFVFLQFALFLFIGLALYTYYRSYAPEPFTGKPDEVFPYFILHEVPSGARGVIVAAVLASAVSTLSSSLNSLASSTYADILKPVFSGMTALDGSKRFPGIGELGLGRLLTVLWCLVLLVVSYLAQNWGGVLETGLTIASFTYGSLLGAFLLSLTGTGGSGTGVSAGMLVGMGAMTAIFFLTDLPWTWFVAAGTAITVLSGVVVSLVLKKKRRGAAPSS